MWRVVFSSTTMASSTTKPVATVSAISERLLMLKPARYITENVPMSDTGTETAGMTAARRLRRKSSTTRITRAIAITRARSTSWMEARTVEVRSIITSRSIAAGIEARRSGRIAMIRSTVSMMFASGWARMMSSTEGLPFAEP